MFILLLQDVHLPLINIYPSMGNSSHHVNTCLHFSQCELDLTISGYLYPLSILYVVAFKKLAKEAPKKNIHRYIIIIIIDYILY